MAVVRVFTVQVQPSANEAMEAIEDRISQLYTEERGYREGRFVVDRDTGTWGHVGVWVSRAAIEALRAHPLTQALREELGPLLVAPPREDIYEIYEPTERG